ncbi:hypothetical protein ACQJBY_011898 [Aegilops geniculata]
MSDRLDAHFGGGRIQASGGGTNKASGFSEAAPGLLRRAPGRKGRRMRERERGRDKTRRKERNEGGTAGGCAVGSDVRGSGWHLATEALVRERVVQDSQGDGRGQGWSGALLVRGGQGRGTAALYVVRRCCC